MDISKFRIPTLNGLNFGLWLDHIQSTTRILDIWDAMRGDIIAGSNPPARDLLVKPSLLMGTPTAEQIATYTQNKTTWSKKNAQGLGIIQAMVSNVIWLKHQALPSSKEVLDALETKFGKAGGAQTYLQLVNMVKIQITDSTDLLPQIQNISG